MQPHEKIKNIRKSKNWSQEEIADKLGITASGYGSIERGDTDVKLSRLKNIAELFEMDLSELFNLNEKSIFVCDNNLGDNSQHTLQVNASLPKSEYQHELEKLAKEIDYLKQQNNDLREINDLLKKAS